MSVSITVEMDEDVYERAKALAAAHKTTVAEMLNRLLPVAFPPPLKRDDMTPILRKMSGILPPMSDEEVDRVIEEERMKKYGMS